uniref:Transmembrane protein 230 n=1 Tax=Melopsittacus undulatus TaxID=13146 RepID=A0A8V5H250_MELUD
MEQAASHCFTPSPPGSPIGLNWKEGNCFNGVIWVSCPCFLWAHTSAMVGGVCAELSSFTFVIHSMQFKKSPPKIPYKAIALAVVLFMIGTFLIIIGALLLAGYISKGGTDRAIPVLIIGILVFLPGFYHLRIAYYASKGYRGYSYDDIPDFDD